MNRLIVVEIAAAFVVIFVLTAFSISLWTNYRHPLGFDYENIWRVRVRDAAYLEQNRSNFSAPIKSHSGTLADILSALRTLPRTEIVEPIENTPYYRGSRTSLFKGKGGASLLVNSNRTTTAALRALNVKLMKGRWFGPEDIGQTYRAVLVNRAFVEQAFESGTDPVGRRIFDARDPDEHGPGLVTPKDYSEELKKQLREGQKLAQRATRIVGVIDDFRQEGEFSDTVPYMIDQQELFYESGSYISLLLKVTPSTDASFEDEITATIESVAPGWLATVTPWAALRKASIASTLLPLKSAATIAAFFIVLVVMGLIGVVWQDVVRRTQEIGLRRALGAVTGSVRRQILSEALIVGVFGIMIGAAIAIQFPLLELVEPIDWGSAPLAIVLSAALILALVAMGALYPSWLASRREPSDTLRYE